MWRMWVVSYGGAVGEGRGYKMVVGWEMSVQNARRHRRRGQPSKYDVCVELLIFRQKKIIRCVN
jgi:hypothetical protein